MNRATLKESIGKAVADIQDASIILERIDMLEDDLYDITDEIVEALTIINNVQKDVNKLWKNVYVLRLEEP